MVTLLRDVITIPERVHRGDFVLKLAEGIADTAAVAQTVRQYVVTPDLAGRFDDALELIRGAVEANSSRAAYLDGSFGSGKSHFMAILHELLKGNPDVRRKDLLVPVVTKHDQWLNGRKFLLVPYHLIGAASLSEAVLGGYARHVAKHYPDVSPPAVYRDDLLIENARRIREKDGDERFIAGLPTHEDEEWGESGWDSSSLDAALTARHGDPLRRQLVSDLLQTHLFAYGQFVSGVEDAFLPLEEGLSIVSRHAREVLGYDVLVLLLDELVLWLSSKLSNTRFISEQAELVSKFVESADWERPAPIVSFIPRQRDLRELVGRDVAGAQAATLFDTLQYWDGRIEPLQLSDANLPAIISERLLTPVQGGVSQIDAAFDAITRAQPQVREALLDAQGGSTDLATFRATYPFSPAFVHTMVDISGALQRERTALRLMLQLLVDYRDTLPLGKLIPLGAIYDVLAAGEDRPFTDKLRQEFEQVRDFYRLRLRPWLLSRHRLSEEAASDESPAPFRGDDLIVKTLLLKALVPNVPALQSLTANRLAALNHGWIPVMPPSRPGEIVAKLLRDLNAEFGEIRVQGNGNPTVEVALIGVDTKAILTRVERHLDDAGKRRMLKQILWQELGIGDDEPFVARREFAWRGTRRPIEVVFANIRDPEVPGSTFEPVEADSLRVIVDYPFDEQSFGPIDDLNRVRRIIEEGRTRSDVLCWLPSFLSHERLDDLGNLVLISYLLQGNRLLDVTPELTEEDRYHAKMEFESRLSALEARIREALKKAYGVASADEADLGDRAEQHVKVLNDGIEIKPPGGVGLGTALESICARLLDEIYPDHPDFDKARKGKAYVARELQTVVSAVEQAMQDRSRRYELPRADQPVVRRIADPLGLGATSEAALVINENWPLAIERRAAAAGVSSADAGSGGVGTADLPVGKLKGWVRAEQPGLPADLVNLVVIAYALIRDRSWIRSGNVVAQPDLKNVPDDMLLRAQELPTADQFQAASTLATAIFELKLQPVRTARTTRLLAEQLRDRSGKLLADAEALVKELERHAEILGLDPKAQDGRLVTARESSALLDSIAGITDNTALLRKLAEFRPGAPAEIYGVSLREAGQVAHALAGAEWQLLDRLPARADTGPDAEPTKLILDRLRSVAKHDEHAAPLSVALAEAKKAALDLFVKTRHPDGRNSPGPVDGAGQVRVRAADLDVKLEELRRVVREQPAAEFEVTWRRIDS